MRGQTVVSRGFCEKFARNLTAPAGVTVAKTESVMSMRIAVALAATIGVGIVGGTQAEARPDVVGFRGDYSAGTIVIKTNERRLYLVVGQGQAMRYPVGVGRAGKQWAGTTQIDGKYLHPAWSPPSEVRRDKPYMPAVIPGGSPRNPMGVAAMTLAGGEDAVHGTHPPASIRGVFSPCFSPPLAFGIYRPLHPALARRPPGVGG